MKKQKSLAKYIEEYIACRRNFGFQLKREKWLLYDFAKYNERNEYKGHLATEFVLQWVLLVKNNNYQRIRFQTIRSFAKYLAIYEPETEIPSWVALNIKCYRPAPYIYSDQEIINLLNACNNMYPYSGLRPLTYRTIFGLLAATGMRVSEALRLTRQDVDLNSGILSIRETKFNKSRLVPVHLSTLQMLHEYADQRDRYLTFSKHSTFFISEKGHALPYYVIQFAFTKLRRELGWKGGRGNGAPRIHDLRHTFACRRILRWYDEGANVDYLIPFLSAYLGHVNVNNTYWYLTGIPELLAITAQRFEQFAQSEKGEKP